MTDGPEDRDAGSIACAINRAAAGRPVPGNRVEMLIDGPAAYAAMLQTIAQARMWIHFENYIVRSDVVGWRFAEQLAERARAGVRVHVLYDWLGSIATAPKLWRYLRAAGVDVRTFHPPRLLDLVTNLSRNHRKLVVADGVRGVIGGLCIGREWTGEGTVDGQPWRDTAVDIVGPAAVALGQSFARTWTVAGGGPLSVSEETAEAPAPGEAEVRVIAGEPGRERAYRVIELLAASSSARLWITDAYLVAPPRLFQALRDAARDGVDVRLLVPGTSDVPFVRNLTRIGYRDLLRSGVRIYEWYGPMLHAKTIMVDNRWVRVGSSNLNSASLLGNYELDVLVEDRPLADAMERQFRHDIARSREVARRAVRGPQRISRVLPTALTHRIPDTPVGRRRSGRELRQRAALAMRAVVANARRSVFGPVTIVLGILALLFLTLPTASAYVTGVLCVWLAIGAGREAFRRRADR